MMRHHAKSLFRDLYAAACGKGSWHEVSYHFFALWSDLIHPFRCVVYGLQNLRAYIPLIWRDRDWDWSCMLELWELKFNRMAELHTNCGHLVRSGKTAAQLRQAAFLCRRVRMDEYTDAGMAAHDKKWGEAHHVFLPTGHGSSEMRNNRLNVRNDKDKENQRKEFLRVCRAGEKQQAADIAQLTLLVRKHLLTWWD